MPIERDTREPLRIPRPTAKVAAGLMLAVLLLSATLIASPGTADAAGGAASDDGSAALIGHGGQCLDVPYQQSVNGQDLWMWPCNGTVAQQWTIEHGRLKVMGKCLDIEGPSLAEGAIAQIWDCEDVPQHRWRVTPAGGIVSEFSGLCLDVAWANTSPMAKVHLWKCNGTSAQLWRLAPAEPEPPQPFEPIEIDCDSEYVESVSLQEFRGRPRYQIDPSDAAMDLRWARDGRNWDRLDEADPDLSGQTQVNEGHEVLRQALACVVLHHKNWRRLPSHLLPSSLTMDEAISLWKQVGCHLVLFSLGRDRWGLEAAHPNEPMARFVTTKCNLASGAL